MSQKAATRGISVTLQSSQTTGNGTVIAIPSSFKNHTFIIKGSAGVASGAVQLEYADDPTYTGVWAQLGSGPITVVVSAELTANFVGIYPFVRARISTTISGGTVTVTYIGG